MKKLALILAIAMIASFAAVPAMADLDIGGSYRAVGTSNDLGFKGVGLDPPNETWVDQRMRVAFNWGVNDNVAVQLRGDFAEMTWGDGYRPEQGTDTLMIDRAFVTIKQGPLTLTVGQQANGWGQGLLWSDQFQGIHADLDFAPFNVKALWSKESEGGLAGTVNVTNAAGAVIGTVPGAAAGNAITDNSVNDDTDIYGLQLGYAADTFTAALTYVTMINDAANATVFGADAATLSGYSGTVTGAFGDVSLGAEIALFDGDNGLNGAAQIDFEGTQLMAFARTAFTEQFKAGAMVIWADDVANATTAQATVIVDDTGFNPFDYAGALGYDNGVRLMPATNTPTSLFDIAQSGAGVLGLILDASFAATESLTFYGKLMYAEPSDDVPVTLVNPGLDSAFGAIANVDYAWMPAVTLSAGMMYIAPDYDATDAQLTAMGMTDDAALQLVVRLGVTF
ncbi:hypothetical protein [Desulfobacula sp.]|uniref:hypothetical protein n=1 Tax=Desulfobacula sp. TaxID=2593537 RepID=UPI002618D26C|nr:hypothetical protein [Desulfobacula sp.]